MKLVSVAAYVLLVGLPGAALACRRSHLTLVVAPAAAGLVSGSAAIAAIATGTRLAPWVVLIAGAAWLALGVSLRRDPWRPTFTPARLAELGAAALPLTPFLYAVRTPPTSQDLHHIWLFHARWLHAGGEAAREAMANAAYLPSHPSYPPLAPAADATIWAVWNGGDPWVASANHLVFTLAAVALLGAVLASVLPGPRLAVLGATAVLSPTLVGLSRATTFRGQLDLAWSVLALTAAVGLLVAPKSRRDLLGPALVALAAGLLTKSDAAPAFGVIAAAALWRHGRERRLAALVVVAALPGLAWMALANLVSDLPEGTLQPAKVIDLVRADPQIVDRLRPTLSALWTELGSSLAVAAVATAIGAVALRRDRRAHGLGSCGWLAGLVAAHLAALVVIYLTGFWDITWWLNTSVERSAMIARAAVAVELVVWVSVGFAALFPGPADRATAEATGTAPAAGAGRHFEPAGPVAVHHET